MKRSPPPLPGRTHRFPVRDYALSATLLSGQVFRWHHSPAGWAGVVGRRHVRLQSDTTGLTAEVMEPVENWSWLETFLQVRADYAGVMAALPQDSAMRAAVAHGYGLRLLRQDPWECLASFLLSSTKRIDQISRIIERLCQTYGDPIPTLPGYSPCHAFPSPARLAGVGETELRRCGMGFRAPYLWQAARKVAGGELDLASIQLLDLPAARAVLTSLAGVGPKIADCVLLFAYGFDRAFPVDVWIKKALLHGYLDQRNVSPRELTQFIESHFGPFAGYAQQFLFHYWRSAR